MRLLVTGASGLLGLNLAFQAAREHTVFGVVNSRAIATDEFETLKIDLTAEDALVQLLDETQPHAVIHCAAIANLEACERNPELAARLNAQIPGLFAAQTAEREIQFLHISTDAVFDGQKGDYSEEDTPNPLSVYARTKLAGEQAVSAANEKAAIARVNFFGWSLSGERSLAEFFYNNLSGGSAVNGFTDVFFCSLLVNHLADILMTMLEKDLSGIYHAVSSECISKYEFGVRFARKFGLDEKLVNPISVTESNLTAARSPRLTLNTEKLTKTLNQALPSIDQGLNDLYDLNQSGYREKILKLKALSIKDG